MGEHRAILFLDAATGREVGRTSCRNYVSGFAEFAGSQHFICADNLDEHFRLVKVGTGKELRRFPRNLDYSSDRNAVSADGRHFATTGKTGAVGVPLAVYEVATGRKLFTATLPDEGWQLAFAPDGRSVVSAGETSVCRFAVPGGGKLGQWRTPVPALTHCLAVGNSAAYLVDTSDDSGVLVAHDAATGRPASIPLDSPLSVPGQPGASALYFGPASNSYGAWDVRTGRPRHDPAGAKSPLTGVALLADGRAVTAEQYLVRVCSAAGRQESPHATDLRSLISSLSADGRLWIYLRRSRQRDGLGSARRSYRPAADAGGANVFASSLQPW